MRRDFSTFHHVLATDSYNKIDIELDTEDFAMKSTFTFLSWLALVNGATVQQNGLPTVDLGYQVHRAISFDVRL
jgi:hypothetical protein